MASTRRQAPADRGPKQPFQAFVDEHADAVGAYLRSLVEASEVEDCAQEAFISALRAYPRFDGRHGRAWILKIARNKAMDSRRRATREDAAPLDSIGPAAGADDAIERASAQAVWYEVARLPEGQRSAVVMRFALDMPFREIGAALDCSDAAARQRVSAGVRALRDTTTIEEVA